MDEDFVQKVERLYGESSLEEIIEMSQKIRANKCFKYLKHCLKKACNESTFFIAKYSSS